MIFALQKCQSLVLSCKKKGLLASTTTWRSETSMDAAIEAVTQKTDEQQPVQDASKQKHDQER